MNDKTNVPSKAKVMKKEVVNTPKKQEKSGGVSLRIIHVWLIIGAVLISAMMFYATYQLSSSFRSLTELSEQQIDLRKAARELMDASDYLTEKVQRFTIDGDMKFLNEYFEEAFEANRREEAVATMTEELGASDALDNLKSAMDGSMELMNQEYYAMKLVIAAKGYTEYPQILDSVELTEADRALTPEEKMHRATELVFNNDYYQAKEQIRENMRASLDILEKMAHDTDNAELKSIRSEMTVARVLIVIQAIGVFIMVLLTSRLGIHPVLNAVDRIKDDSPLQEVGASEFRYLARAYNKMYGVYKSSLENLNFKVSHDELTGAYNRFGYDLLLTSVNLSDTYMILLDVDNFKTVNDTYGHEFGDKILVKLTQILKRNFRSDDYVCRIGGDEFVVFMVHTAKTQQKLITSKIEKINVEMANTDDGNPAASISAGIAHGTDASDPNELFEKADEAMYKAKKCGKCTYYFYD